MNAQHTPGPWKIDPDSDLLISNADLCAVGDTIARAATKADARLIAAAPELFEALESMLSQSAQWMPSTGKAGDVKAKARAAIAKATGLINPRNNHA